jgi:hypothetical protein
MLMIDHLPKLNIQLDVIDSNYFPEPSAVMTDDIYFSYPQIGEIDWNNLCQNNIGKINSIFEPDLDFELYKNNKQTEDIQSTEDDIKKKRGRKKGCSVKRKGKQLNFPICKDLTDYAITCSGIKIRYKFSVKSEPLLSAVDVMYPVIKHKSNTYREILKIPGVDKTIMSSLKLKDKLYITLEMLQKWALNKRSKIKEFKDYLASIFSHFEADCSFLEQW